MSNLRRVPVILTGVALFFLTSMTDGYTQPNWVSSYGSQTSYSDGMYITGFGMSTREKGVSREETLENAKTQASGDLIRKVRVSVKSSVSSEVRETQARAVSNFAAMSKTVSDLELEGMRYDVYNDRKAFYALAYVNRREASQAYGDRVQQALKRIKDLRSQAMRYEEQGKNDAALETYLKVKPLFGTYYELYAITNILKSSASSAFEELDAALDASSSERSVLMKPQELVVWENEASAKVEQLLEKPSQSFDDAVKILVRQLSMQDIGIRGNRVVDLTYQDSDFSSAFGAYAARSISGEMTNSLATGSVPTITQGIYWVFDDTIELSVNVLDEKGQKMGSGQVKFPKGSVPPGLDLEPRNFEQALRDQKVLRSENLSDGGINVEVWTDKGLKTDNVVLQENQEIKFYFRVNQPSYLQLTYVLANGMKVMLWDSYYIGADRVNKIVEFPETFIAAEPLGVERLLVTAYSKEPPMPAIIKQNISGETYTLIQDELSQMVAKTRGLKRKNPDKVRVGLASLSITTIPRQ